MRKLFLATTLFVFSAPISFAANKEECCCEDCNCECCAEGCCCEDGNCTCETCDCCVTKEANEVVQQV